MEKGGLVKDFKAGMKINGSLGTSRFATVLLNQKQGRLASFNWSSPGRVS